jgi:hypothetical protein
LITQNSIVHIPDTCKTALSIILNLQNLGISLENVDFVVALAGTPMWKSTVFMPYGFRQHTVLPGKTVSRAEEQRI